MIKLKIKNYKIPLHTSILAFLTVTYRRKFKRSERTRSSKIIIRTESNSIDIKTKTTENIFRTDNSLKFRHLRKIKCGNEIKQIKSQTKSNEKLDALETISKLKKEVSTNLKFKSAEKESINMSSSIHSKQKTLINQINKIDGIHGKKNLSKNKSFSIVNHDLKNEVSSQSVAILLSENSHSFDRKNSKGSFKNIKNESSIFKSMEIPHKKFHKDNSFNLNTSSNTDNINIKKPKTKSINDDSDKFIFTNHLQIDHDSLREKRGAFLESIDSFSGDLNHSMGSISFTFDRSEDDIKSNLTELTFI